jgi:Tfp pilus assembly protein PilF
MKKKTGPLSRGVIAVILSAQLGAACTSTQNRDTAGLGKPEGATATYTELAKGYLARGNTSAAFENAEKAVKACLLYTSPSPRDRQKSRMPSSA